MLSQDFFHIFYDASLIIILFHWFTLNKRFKKDNNIKLRFETCVKNRRTISVQKIVLTRVLLYSKVLCSITMKWINHIRSTHRRLLYSSQVIRIGLIWYTTWHDWLSLSTSVSLAKHDDATGLQQTLVIWPIWLINYHLIDLI